MKMKKNDCNIVRDLMPLVLDRAASDESREMVEEHIAACEACGKQYDAMKAALPEGLRMEYEEEQKKFIHALKAMRRTKLKRRLTAIALSVILCAAAAFGGLFAYDRLVNRYSVPVDNSLYSLSLARLADGSIAVTAEMHGINFDTQTNGTEQVEGDRTVCYLYYSAAPLHAVSKSAREGTKALMTLLGSGGNQSISEIRQGAPGNSILLWAAGEPIPAASEEMEAYFALDKQWMAWWENLPESEDGTYKVLNAMEDYSWQARLEEAWLAVPEWK